MIQEIRTLMSNAAILPGGVDGLADDGSLYDAGLTSFGSVQLMLAIEEHFDIEFPEDMLTRKTFSSIASVAGAVSSLTADKAA